ncbi:uncharacterized protein N7496_002047 [Penicillium cataractarum]|uniref:Nucleolar protein Dnt1-like N-terminal domain-containing protein n=1 Tax=Penicillium cataractarum TaxID=2100454 RepID=A0A9X0B7F4_9EURO|nr:uncharacterized protein N7496_002047 [Penicillium cataractarum]KAJ5390979.1 hypothetical protein N7496_002047 [Penicillium cataractarum]
MSSAPKLRLTVRVFPREEPGLSGLNLGGTHENQNQSEPAKPRQFLLIIKDPEKLSLGNLANQIKDQWRELWPSEEPLQIKKLLDDAYPDAPFSIHNTVADIWVDNGRHAREGFDQHGTVRVIPTPLSLAPSPTPRFQREGSVFQDVEGEAAREAKRKLLDAAISANDSLIGERETSIRTPSRDKEPDLRERQSKRPRLTEQNDAPSPSPAGSQRETTSGPLFYNDRRAPSFALPRGHRSHPPSNSKSSPEKGLGLGVTASPVKAKTAHTKGPSSMPPPPLPRYSLRGASNSSPLESSSQDDSPLENRKSKRLFNSVPREISRDKERRTRANVKASGSSKKSHRASSMSGPTGVSILNKPPNWAKRDKEELEEIRKLRGGSNTNPECFELLRKMEELHEARLKLKSGSHTDAQERKRLLDNTRRALGHRRGLLQKLKATGELYNDNDVQTTTSENFANEGHNRDSDESSEAELPQRRSKRHKAKRQDLSSDTVATRRISSLRAHTQSRRDRLSDVQDVQVVIDDLGSARVSPNKSLDANDVQSNVADPEDDGMEDCSALREHKDEDDDIMTDSDGGDIEFEEEGLEVEQTSPIHNPSFSQGPSPRKTLALGAEPEDEENGFQGVFTSK